MTDTTAAPIRVGHTVSGSEALDRLPLGTVIAAVNAMWTKETPSEWASGTGTRATAAILGQHRCVVQSFPEGDSFTPAPLTVAQVKWRFRRGAIAAAQNHGVGVDLAIRTLERMGAELPPIGNGVPVAASDNLPDGTVMYTGSPNVPNRFGVFVRRNGRWVPVLGEQTQPGYEGIVDSVNGVRDRPAWLDEAGTANDPEVGRWKARAWRVGFALKREQRWCGVYEEVVQSLGITREDAQRYPNAGQPATGARTTPEEAVALPDGSLLFWRHSGEPERWALYVRTANINNAARTARIGGTDPSHDNYQRRMDVLAVAEETGLVNYTIPSDPPGMVRHFPARTWLETDQDQRYTVAQDGLLWSGHTNRLHATGTYSFDQFESEVQWIVRRVTP